MNKREHRELIVTVKRRLWLKDDGSFGIFLVEPLPERALPDPAPSNDGKSGPVVLGPPPSAGMLPGVQYALKGRWQAKEGRGQQFNFVSAIERQAATRHGVVEYLARNASFIGDAIAHALVDAYGPERAIDELKANPEDVANRIRGLTPERAMAAAADLIRRQSFQDTEVKLTDLLAGRGFAQPAIDACIKKWGVMAPEVMRRDPFKMMLTRIPGAGFARCDQLWQHFGLPTDRMKRQVMAVWNHLQSDQSGSTWHAKDEVIRTVARLVTGHARPERAVAIAVRAGRLQQCEREGRLWLAETRKAADEAELNEMILTLMER